MSWEGTGHLSGTCLLCAGDRGTGILEKTVLCRSELKKPPDVLLTALRVSHLVMYERDDPVKD